MQPRERESAFEKIDKARKLLGLPERASVKTIRERYHELSRQWHPDLNQANPQPAGEQQQRINEAYRTLMDYCAGFEYSFRREDIQNFQSGEEFWWEHFGQF
jgi:DnaJ-class molecular chaperone